MGLGPEGPKPGGLALLRGLPDLDRGVDGGHLRPVLEVFRDLDPVLLPLLHRVLVVAAVLPADQRLTRPGEAPHELRATLGRGHPGGLHVPEEEGDPRQVPVGDPEPLVEEAVEEGQGAREARLGGGLLLPRGGLGELLEHDNLLAGPLGPTSWWAWEARPRWPPSLPRPHYNRAPGPCQAHMAGKTAHMAGKYGHVEGRSHAGPERINLSREVHSKIMVAFITSI